MRKIAFFVFLLALCVCICACALADSPTQFTLGNNLTDRFANFQDVPTIHLEHSNYMGQVWLNDYDYWADQLEGVPTWTVTAECSVPVEGDVLAYDVWQYDQNRGVTLALREYPEGLPPINYIVTCAWGSYTQTYRGTLTFAEPASLPTDFICAEADENGVIHMVKGQETALHLSFAPDSFQFADQLELGFDLPDGLLMQTGGDQTAQLYTWVVEPNMPGLYDGELWLISGNIMIKKNFQFDVTPSFTLGNNLTDRFANFQDASAIRLEHSDYMGQVWLEENDDWAEYLAGAPQWEVTWSNASGGSLRYKAWEYGQSSGILLYIADYPLDFSPISYTVTCTWGDLETAYNGVLSFAQPASLPTDFICAEADGNGVIHMVKGQETALHLSFAPDSFQFADQLELGFDLPDGLLMQKGGGRTAQLYTWVVEPNMHGLYDGELWLISGNIMIKKNFRFNVHAFSLTADISDEFATPAFFDDNAHIAGLSRDDYMGWIKLDDAGFWDSSLSGEPQWSLQYHNDHGGEIQFSADRSPRYVGGRLSVVSYPSDNSPITFTLACEWDGRRAEYQGTLCFVTPAAAPTDLLLDGSTATAFSMTLGEERTLRFLFKPAASNSESFSIDGIRLLVQNFDNTYLEYTGGENYAWVVKPLQTGDTTFSMGLKMGNVVLTKNYTVHIVDELIPYFADEGYSITRYLAPLSDPHANRTVSTDSTIGWCPDNYDQLLEAYGPDADANWRLEHISGPEFQYHMQHNGGKYCYLYFDTYPQAPGVGVYRVVCDWGGHSGSFLVAINFIQTELPSGTTLNAERNRNILNMKRGKSKSFQVGLQNSADFIPYSLVVSASPDQVSITQNGMDFTLTPLVSGAIPLQISVACKPVEGARSSNLRVVSDMALLVTEDGEGTSLRLPSSLTTIEADAFNGTAANTVGLADSVTAIGPRAFANSPSLMLVNLPASLTSIDPSAFDKDVVMVTSSEANYFWAVENHFYCLYIP